MPGEGLEPPRPRGTPGFKPRRVYQFRHPGEGDQGSADAAASAHGSVAAARARGEERGHGGAIVDDRAAAAARRGTPGRRPRAQARVEDRDDADVGVAADQPPEALPQLEHRRRQGVVAEPVAAGRLDRLAARLVAADRPGAENGQLVDHEQRERLARDVDALPEGRRREQHRVDLVAEALEQPLPRRLALDEHLVGHAPGEPGAQHARAPGSSRSGRARGPRESASRARDLLGDALGELRRRAGRASRAARRGAPARGSRRASRRRARARGRGRGGGGRTPRPRRWSASPRRGSRSARHPRGGSRSSAETSTGAQAIASGSAQTTRSSPPASRHAST